MLAAAERKELAAQKFDEWVRFKDNFDRGLALFSKLDGSHCEVRVHLPCTCLFEVSVKRSISDTVMQVTLLLPCRGLPPFVRYVFSV